MDGNWIKTFELTGRGPGETLYPEDMQIDKEGRKLVILERMGQILRFSIDEEMKFIDQFNLEKGGQSLCITKESYVVQYRVLPEEIGNDIKTVGIYNKKNLKKLGVINSDYASEHWLITRQLSRGSIYCSEYDDIYISELYIPRLRVYDKGSFKDKLKLLFQNLNLTRLVLEYRDGTPVQTLDIDQYIQSVKNVIADKDFIYMQVERFLRDRSVEIHTYKIDKNNLTAEYIGETGLIHQIDEGRIITSLQDAYPQIIIYKIKSIS